MNKNSLFYSLFCFPVKLRKKLNGVNFEIVQCLLKVKHRTVKAKDIWCPVGHKVLSILELLLFFLMTETLRLNIFQISF